MRELFRCFSPRLFLRSLAFALSVSIPISSAATVAGSPDGIAVAVVFDTSASMRQPLGQSSNGAAAEPKFQVAQRAFQAVLARFETFTKSPNARPLSLGTYVFRGSDAAVAEPIAPFDAARLRRWLGTVRPDGSTPLGDAIFLAGRDLLATPAASRHLLVLTDGAHTSGRAPATVLENLQLAAARKQTPVFTHVIALDIAPSTFAALQRQGATLIGAADEAQLNAQFDFILEEKILVEAVR